MCEFGPSELSMVVNEKAALLFGDVVGEIELEDDAVALKLGGQRGERVGGADGGDGGLEEWFRSGEGQPFPAGGGESRLDEYLRDADQTELSVKRRGEELGVEVKGLVALSGQHLPSPFTGQVEIWAKWGLISLELGRNTIT